MPFEIATERQDDSPDLASPRTRVAHLITSLNLGGAEQQLKQLVLASNGQNVEHMVISMTGLGPLGGALRSAHFEVRVLGMRRGTASLAGLFRLIGFLRNWKPDVLHCWLYHSCLLGLLAGGLTRVPRVVWCLRSADEDLLSYSFQTRTVVTLCRVLSRFVDAIVVNSEAGRSLHARWGYSKSKMLVIYNGVNLDLFRRDPIARSSVRQELNIPGSAVLVGLIARYHPMKDHDTFFRAAQLVRASEPNAHFLLAGEGVNTANPEVSRMVRERGLPNVVHLLGPRSDIPRITASLDVACLSSWSESFPNAICEPMACGVPCAATDVGDVARMVGDTGIVVPARNPEALAQALLSLLEMPLEQRTELGRRAAERAKTFSLERAVGAYATLYRTAGSVSLGTRFISLLYVVTSQISTVLLKGQLKYLREAGYEVSVVSSPGLSLDLAGTESSQTHFVPMVREIGGISDLVSLWRLLRLMRRLKPAVTNVSTPKAGLLGGLASCLSGVPCRVYTLRGLRCETAKGVRRWALLLSERIACRCAHLVICVSESLQKRAVALGVLDPRRSVVLGSGSSNGVDADRFAPTPERIRQAAGLRNKLDIPAEAPVIGFVGRFTRDKGLRELIEAYLQLRQQWPRLHLLLVGEFEDGDQVASNICEVIQGDSQVIYTGIVQDTAPYYHVMDMLVLPTYREGFPNAVLESHAAGKPVVAARATGVVDAVLDGVNGILVPVGDSKALANGLERLLKDRELAAAMGTAGRVRVQREFRQERIWEALAQEYSRLLEGRGLRSPQPHSSKAGQASALGTAVMPS